MKNGYILSTEFIDRQKIDKSPTYKCSDEYLFLHLQNQMTAVPLLMKFFNFFPFFCKTRMIKVGDTVTLTRPSHGSVGITSEIRLDSRYFDCRILYNVRADCAPGGDSGTKTYHLTAIKSGLTTIEIVDYFRNEITDTVKIKYRIKR